MIKIFKFLFTVSLILGLLGPAQAGQFPVPPFSNNHNDIELTGYLEWLTTGSVGNNTYDASDLFQPFGGTLSGQYEVTGLGWEAAYYNDFGTDNVGDLFTGNVSSTFGSLYTIDFTNDNAYFNDKNHGLKVYFDSSSAQVELWELETSVTVDYISGLSGYQLPAGTIIAGFNDTGNDSDHDDLFVSLNPNPVPEPTTMLLFGAGLVGLAGFGRKKFKK
jgi:hypothetical protein